MSTYRSRLEAGVHPATDPRRGPELRDELERFAETLAPRWRRTGDRDDFAHALLRIGARLAEESTVRLDASARRDALAFFAFLGLPPGAPRPATGVLVLAPDPKLLAPVSAPAQTQVSVATADGEQVTFETGSRVRLVPGGIAELYSVDPSTDRIDKAPAQVTSPVAPTPWAGQYKVITFSGAGSLTVQLSPPAGLKEQDLLEIDQHVYRVQEEGDDGLITLMDALESPADTDDLATRVGQFRAFDLRNVQRHEVHIGHRELFNLEQPATITLDVSPASLAGDLAALDIDFALFGTRGDEGPEWHSLDVLGVIGSHFRLAKAWPGSVEETKVNGHKNRWLRARLRTPLKDRVSATEPVADLRLTVASADDENDQGNSAAEAPAARKNEGSRTVLHAAHNGTPLATTGRFHPFGPEPVRFDTFALAAPEALSKKGALASLTVTLSDSSMTSFGISIGNPQAQESRGWRGFGVGTDGDLQILLADRGRFQWLESTVVSVDGSRVQLGSTNPVAINLPGSDVDVVVAADRKGGLWSGVVHCEGKPAAGAIPANWHEIERLERSSPDPVGPPIVVPTPVSVKGTVAIALDIVDGELYSRPVGTDAKVIEPWTKRLRTSADAPTLISPDQLTSVQGSAWPLRPDRLEVLACDRKGALWHGNLNVDVSGAAAVTWTALRPAGGTVAGTIPQSRTDVSPAATWYRDDDDEHLWVAFASGEAPEEEGSTAKIGGIESIVGKDGTVEVVDLQYAEVSRIDADSALHSDPRIMGIGERPVVAGLGSTKGQVVIWQGESEARTTSLQGVPSSNGPILIQSSSDTGNAVAEILLPGEGERLFRGNIPPAITVPYELHNLVELESKDVAHRVEILPKSTGPELDTSPTVVRLSAENRRIVDGDHRVYEVDSPALEIDSPLRFLRLHDESAPLIGELVSQQASVALRLSPQDTLSAKTSRLVINGSSYVIQDLSPDRVATLDPPLEIAGLTEESAEYFIVTKEFPGRVTKDHLRTLAVLLVADRPGDLVFGPPARPAIQHIKRAGKDKDPVSVQLAHAWEVEPTNQSAAGVTGDPVWTDNVRPREYDNPELSWEYFDGEAWQKLENGFLDTTNHLSNSGKLRFIVPRALTTTEIGGKEAYWIRARLIGGDYGRPVYKVVSREETPAAEDEPPITTQTLVVDTSELNPPEILTIEATFSSPEGVLAEAVLVENNGDVLDQTQAATVPTATFELFQGAAALDPDTDGRAVFAGFTGLVDAGPFTVFVDAEERPGRGTVDVDVLTPDGWQRVAVDDETASMRRTGLVHLSLDRPPVPLRLFGEERVWLRFRAGDDAESGPGRDRADVGLWAPVVRWLLPNAVHVTHAATLGLEILGSSQGEPGTIVFLSAVPVLPDSVELRVREDLSEEERTALEERSRERYRASTDSTGKTVVTDPDRVPGTWVLWERVDSLIGQNKDARVYVLEPRTGRVTFGDDRTGRIPPAGRDNIRCFSYQQGGGADGNVPAWSETRLTSAVSGVGAVVLPLGTAGGADAPPADAVFATAPQQLRHAGRALAPADVEDLAVTSSGEILRARCLRPAGPGEPLRVAVVVRDRASRRPEPTLVQRDAVAAAIRAAGWGGLDTDAVDVSGPHYVPVTVHVTLITPPRSRAEVEQTARERLVRFFDPEHGGPHGSGWPFGRLPNDVDVLRLLGQVPGIDRIAAVGINFGADVRNASMPPEGMVCAEPADIAVMVSGEGSL
jgi:hypothetical protein